MAAILGSWEAKPAYIGKIEDGLKEQYLCNFPGGRLVRNLPSNARHMGSIPGQELGSHILFDIAKINNNNAKVIKVFTNVFSVYLSVYISLLLWL